MKKASYKIRFNEAKTTKQVNAILDAIDAKIVPLKGYTRVTNQQVGEKLRREREGEIRHLACHAQQYRNELTAYHRSLQTIESVLRKNTDYEDAPTYAMIRRDVERFIQLLSKD